MEKDEEWNNFMHKITEISTIVEGLTSNDKQTSERAIEMADKYLKEKNCLETDKEIEVKLKYDRSMINKTTEEKPKTTNQVRIFVMKNIETIKIVFSIRNIQ